MSRVVVWNFDFLRNRIATGDSCLTGVQWRTIHALAAPLAVGVESIAGEPVVAPAWLISSAVRTVSTGLSRNICAFQLTLQETVFGSLFLGIGWKVIGIEK